MYYYAFTIRRLAGSIEEKIHGPTEHIAAIKRRYTHLEIEYHYEVVHKANGSHNIHLHGMIKTPKKVLYKFLHPGEGYHFWIDACKSVRAWTVYITKDCLRTIGQALQQAQAGGFPLEGPAEHLQSDNDDSSSIEDETNPALFKQKIV